LGGGASAAALLKVIIANRFSLPIEDKKSKDVLVSVIGERVKSGVGCPGVYSFIFKDQTGYAYVGSSLQLANRLLTEGAHLRSRWAP
jgi:hypothetical protein